MPNGAANTDALPPTCEVRGWEVFAPGLWKGTLYTPEMCARVPANFDRLRGHLVPVAKIGHDRSQRLAKSLGFLNVGKVVRCVPTGGGRFALDIVGIPTAVGGEISAGRLNSGSVELLPKYPDPADPSKDIEGPVLTGVAFLGEEQPALKGFRPPRATFADGRPVPPARDPAPWLNAMAEVATVMMAELVGPKTVTIRGRDYSELTLCFSDYTGAPNMDPKAQLAAIGLTPEQIEQVMAICGGGAAAPAPAPPPAPAPANEPAPMSAAPVPGKDDPVAKLMSEFAAFKADCTKQFGALSKFAEDEQKKGTEAQMAAFNAYCEPKLKAVAAKKSPDYVNTVIKPVLTHIGGAAFSAAADRLKEVDALFAPYLAMPDDPRLKGAPAAPPAPGAAPALTQDQLDTLNTEAYRRSGIGNAVRQQMLAVAAK